MKHVSILIPESAVLAAIDDPRHVLSQVNSFCAGAGKPAVFDIKFVGIAAGSQTSRQRVHRSR